MTSCDFRLGRWQDVLAVVDCDALICDPPYSARTHEGHDDGAESTKAPTGQQTRESLNYASWSPDDVASFVAAFAGRVRGWWACMTSHDLIPAYEAAYADAGLKSFAPVVIIQKRPRLVGDGPSSWAVYMMVARPRTRHMATWGCLPGAYDSVTVKGSGIAGTKPIGLMRAIVRDYSRPGDLVCDPFVGSGTTAVAALIEGRRFVGSEQKPEHYEIARRRLDRGYTPTMF
jgi:site-specific DNA-methyltransferase (adenine-specific)